MALAIMVAFLAFGIVTLASPIAEPATEALQFPPGYVLALQWHLDSRCTD